MSQHYRVAFFNRSHSRSWHTVVRASSPERAVGVAWSNITRPKWVVKSLPSVGLWNPMADPAVRGFVREVRDE